MISHCIIIYCIKCYHIFNSIDISSHIFNHLAGLSGDEKCPAYSLYVFYPVDLTLQQMLEDTETSAVTRSIDPDDNPAFVFTKKSGASKLAYDLLDSPFHRNFALLFRLMATSDTGGVLFALTDKSQMRIQLGVKLARVKKGGRQVEVYYSDSKGAAYKPVATFPLPTGKNVWTRFAIAVSANKISFYHNCNTEPKVVTFNRSNRQQLVEPGAAIMVGHGGAQDEDKFEVSHNALLFLSFCAPPFVRSFGV